MTALAFAVIFALQGASAQITAGEPTAASAMLYALAGGCAWFAGSRDRRRPL